jgi:hypothetical protein
VLTVAHLQKVVTEAVRATIGPTQGVPQSRSWAIVAIGGPILNLLNLPSQSTKAIPLRIDRELLVRGTNLPADLVKRTLAEII